MQWKIINGWYCVTACGFMSWKFRTLQEGIKWAFVSKKLAMWPTITRYGRSDNER